jgi:NADH-quinone oxidoreductase subunit N
MTQAFNPADLLQLLPEVAIAVAGLLVLTLDFAVPAGKRGWLGGVSLVGVAVAAALALRQATGPRAVVFSGLHVVDMYATFFKLVFLVSAAIVILLSVRFLQDQQVPEGEFYTLLLFATLGAMLMASAYDLLSLFVGLETLSISTYALCGFLKKDQRCNEGALKYLLMGAFSTGVLLYGMVLLYGFAGGTGLDTIARAAAMAGPATRRCSWPWCFWRQGSGSRSRPFPSTCTCPTCTRAPPRRWWRTWPARQSWRGWPSSCGSSSRRCLPFRWTGACSSGSWRCSP